VIQQGALWHLLQGAQRENRRSRWRTLPSMRRAALLYNPESGRQRARRRAHVEEAAQALRAAGIDAEAIPTRAPGAGGEQALEAARAGCDLLLACGGDGTVNELLQGVMAAAAEGFTQPALGVIPLGTGNALANDLGLPRSPQKAAQALLRFAPRRIAAGRAEFPQTGAVRWFLCLAGVGADARMVYGLHLGRKRRLGMTAYYLEGVRQWLRGGFPMFEAEWRSAAAPLQRAAVSQVLAVRLGYFGGFLKRLAPQATLERDDAHVVLIRSASRFTFAAYTLRSYFEREWRIGGVEVVPAREVTCRPASGASIYVELDGEIAGTLPVRLTIEPAAVPLLMPPRP
jgi:diacylglycerol kinase (ATP)